MSEMPSAMPPLVEAVHAAVDCLWNYQVSAGNDRREVQQALDLLQTALSEYYDALRAGLPPQAKSEL